MPKLFKNADTWARNNLSFEQETITPGDTLKFLTKEIILGGGGLLALEYEDGTLRTIGPLPDGRYSIVAWKVRDVAAGTTATDITVFY